jgi:hypothetical protein
MTKLIISAFAVLLAIGIKNDDRLTGRWQTKPSEKGTVTGVVFMPDNTFEGFINRKPFVTGKYSLDNDIFRFTDNGCNGAEGVYKMIAFSNDDSLKFEMVSDTCTRRRQGMERLVLGRVK